jgi:pyruvate,water dikinase
MLDTDIDRHPAPAIVPLGAAQSGAAELVGAKAANLARAQRLGLHTVDGFVVTTTGAETWARQQHAPELRRAWEELSAVDTRPLVVRSSSTVEDDLTSSYAGMFESVLRVRGWPSFVEAVDRVLESAGRYGTAAPMAVLVQPWIDASIGGVAFGCDPVTGADNFVVSFQSGGAHGVVGGTEGSTTIRLSRHGRLLDAPDGAPKLTHHQRHAIARLLRRLHRHFGHPQDIEWAIDLDGRLWLFQTRPVTAGLTPVAGPVLGPGPVAETFPDALAPLEEDLWIPPLREGLGTALVLAGVRRPHEVERSPVVVTVEGRPAVDLDLIGAPPRRAPRLRLLDPRPGIRRMAAAWRVGRLTAALPQLADELLRTVDDDLLAVPPLARLDEEELLLIARNARTTLRALHGYEILAGMLLADQPQSIVEQAAMRAVRGGRAVGRDDGQIIGRDPVTLSLVPPRIGPTPKLPDTVAPPDRDAGTLTRESPDPPPREMLRLRVRWVHELTARAMWELATRLTECGALARPDDIRSLSLDELDDIVSGDCAPVRRAAPVSLDDVPPLPNAFRLRENGDVVAVAANSTAQGAGGGRAEGVVYIGDDPPPGSVLVVDVLAPQLAASLPNLSGLVAQSGTPLSHVAILARELGVPTVVGYSDATSALTPGERVLVDGSTGEVTPVEVRS